MKRRIKIALLGPFPPAVGGIVYSIQGILNSPLGLKYQFVCFHTYSRKGGSSSYQKETISNKITRIPLDLLQYIYFLIKNNPYFIHIHTSFGKWSFWRDSVYLVISRLFGKEVFLQIHGGYLNLFLRQYPILNALIVRLLRSASLITVLSRQQLRPFHEIGFDGKVHRIPNMINLNTIQGIHPKRSVFNLPDRHYIILLVAPHLFVEKGVYEFVHAAIRISRQRNDVIFAVVGSGGEEARLKAICKDNRSQHKIRFFGNLGRNEVLSLMSISDLFVLPSWSEGFPMVILEAMSVGLPVISTDVGAIPEIITNGIHGYVIHPKNEQTLVQTISWMLKNPLEMKRIGHNNVEEIKKRYEVNLVYHLYENCYRKIIGNLK